jgi:hypothetical protein
MILAADITINERKRKWPVFIYRPIHLGKVRQNVRTAELGAAHRLNCF